MARKTKEMRVPSSASHDEPKIQLPGNEYHHLDVARALSVELVNVEKPTMEHPLVINGIPSERSQQVHILFGTAHA